MSNNLIVQDLKTNLKAQEKLFKLIWNVGARSAWKGGVRIVSDALDVETTADNLRILNPSPLDTIIGYIMQDTKGEGARENPPHRRLNIIAVSLNSYCVHLNSLARMDLVLQANDLAAVLTDMENNRQIIRDASKKRVVDREAERIRKAKVAKEIAY